MRIIIPNAKELNTQINSQPFQTLAASSQKVLNLIGEKSPDDLANLYKVSTDKAQLEWDRWQRIKLGQAKTYPAWQMYDGLMYRYMDRRDLSKVQEDYLRNHVRLATALYGLVNPFESISPHRLDFQISLKIGKQSLKQFWRPYYDQEVKQEKNILSLASSEFEQVFSPAIQSRMTRVIFKEEKNGQLKVHSTISKKGRGRLLSWMVKHQIIDLDKVKLFDLDGFSFDSTNSKENLFLFIRKQ